MKVTDPVTVDKVLARLPTIKREDPEECVVFKASDRWATYHLGIDPPTGQMWVEIKPASGGVAIRMFGAPTFTGDTPLDSGYTILQVFRGECLSPNIVTVPTNNWLME